MKIKMSLNEIAERLFPMLIKLSPKEQEYSLALYRILAKGNPVSRDKLAAELHISREEVDSFLKKSFGIYYDGEGNIIGYIGLTILKMTHRFTINKKTLYTWCAWDSLFIPALLNMTAKVESVCHKTKKLINLTISPHKVEKINPDSAVMSILIPDNNDPNFKENCSKDVIKSFCHYVFFFESLKAGLEWVNDRKESYALLSIDEAFKLGGKLNEYVHGNAMSIGVT